MSVIDSQLQVSGETFQHNAAAMRAVIDDLRRTLAQTARGGSDAARAKHTARGKLLARERIDALLDRGSALLEIAPLAAHGVILGSIVEFWFTFLLRAASLAVFAARSARSHPAHPDPCGVVACMCRP